ncbi:uncharacterized protein LOC135386181 isoform X2 [Ornithodoros turicata]|uniref:uncharacterized protein LOC135386181 isoform X2 n=1 Tax=Ornithodoros turicata TaxID=34597 RepID=UPI003139D5E5
MDTDSMDSMDTTDVEEILFDVLTKKDSHGFFTADYLRFFAFLTIAVFLKTIQRQISIPYTVLVFLFVVSTWSTYLMLSARLHHDHDVRWLGVQAIIVFLPAFVVHTTQGINNYIFRRCHVEIIVFSIGTFSITLLMSTVYAMHRVSDGTWPFRECVFFGVFMSCVERLPMSDELFKEGRFPVMATMIQSEALFNAAMSWCIFGYYTDDREPELNSILLVPLYHQLVALLAGFFLGLATMWVLQVVAVIGSNSSIAVVVCGTYFTYWSLEYFYNSGVPAVVAYAMVINSHRFFVCTELHTVLEDYWDVLYDILGTLATFVSATYTAFLFTQYFSELDWKEMSICYAAKCLFRCCAVVAVYPVIGHFGYQVTVRQAAVLAWMGIKGTFSASLVTIHHLLQQDMLTENMTKSYLFAIWDMVLTQMINVTFLPVVLKFLGVLDVSDVEKRTMSDAVDYLQEATDEATSIHRADNFFLLVDWIWVRRNTLISNPFETTFRFHTYQYPRIVRRRRGIRRRKYRGNDAMAVENVLRIEQVSYSRQYRQGVIQQKTKMTLLAALQYPFDKKVYLDMDIIGSIVSIPDWIVWLKENISEIREDDGTIDDSFSLSDRIEKPMREKIMDLFEHAYYEVVITASTLGVALVLLGLLRHITVQSASSGSSKTFVYVLVTEAVYLAMFTTEVAIMISAYGQRFVNMDAYSRIDLLLVATCMFLFALQLSFFVIQETSLESVLVLSFVATICVRFMHTVKYIDLLAEGASSLVHQYLDSKIYAAYEAGHAIVTGEEEVQRNVWKFVDSEVLATEIRGRATLNRLMVLRRLVEIQTRFPGVMVAFRTRQASTTILSDVTRQLRTLRRDGLLDDSISSDVVLKLNTAHMRIIGGPCSMPTSYKPIAMLRVIPWIPSDAIRQFLAIKIRPVSYSAGDIIVEQGEENPILLAYSGILKIEGEFEDQHDGVLPNSTSPLFYFNEGYFVDYVAAPACIGVLGLVSDAASITRVVAETQINAYVIPRARVLEAMSIFTRPPSFLYHIWHHIARVVASLVLQTDTKYQTWPLEKISRRLESFLLPDLSECNRFQLTSDIQEAVLVQGIALDTETQDLYTAPVCLPSKPMRLVFPTRETRVRNVLLLVAEDTYKVPLEYDWLQKKSGDEDREAEYNERFWGRERGFDHEGSLKQYSVEPSSL